MNIIGKVSIIGAGTMGAGIAINVVLAGHHVTLIDTQLNVLEQAAVRLKIFFKRQVDKSRLTSLEADAAISRLSLSSSLIDAAGSGLVIEAVFENLEVKRQVFVDLERVIDHTTILATNTSALSVRDIGSGLNHPTRLCGLHYFSPAEVNPVVEVISSALSDEKIVKKILNFALSCGKTPILCRDRSGFALNRFFCPYTNEAVRCMDEGKGTPAQIDHIAKETFGLAVGPFFVMNIIKPKINLAAIRNLAHLDPFYEPAASMVSYGDAGKSWNLTEQAEILKPKVARVISDRLKGAVFFAVLQALVEKVATPCDIDIGAQKAFTFTIGPCKMMVECGEAEVGRLVELVQFGASGLVYSVWPQLEEFKKTNKSSN
jgi:3-hydroxybutyryl-CoA dehydrogenase